MSKCFLGQSVCLMENFVNINGALMSHIPEWGKP